MTRLVPLSKLIRSISQGLATQRYEVNEGEGGEPFRIVQTRQLDTLEVPGRLPELQLQLTGERLDLSRYRLTPGTVVVATRTWPVKASAVTEAAAGALAGQNLALLSPTPEINPLFLVGLLRSEFLAGDLGVHAAASGQPMLSLKQLQEVQVPLPPMAVQQALAALFLEREAADQLARESTEQRRRVVEAALHTHLTT